MVLTQGMSLTKSLDSLVDNFDERLLTLDLSLKELESQRLISRGEHSRSLKKIRFLEKSINELRHVHFKLKSLSANPLYSELEKLGPLSSAELSTYGSYLSEKFSFLSRYNRFLQKLSEAFEPALKGKLSRFRLILWLSKLRRALRALEKDIRNLEFDLRTAKLVSEKMAKDFPVAAIDRFLGSTQVASSIFKDIDNLTSRLANKNREFQKEEAIVFNMMQWLSCYERRLEKSGSSLSVPTPLSLTNAKVAVTGDDEVSFDICRGRLELASAFWNDVLLPSMKSWDCR